MTKYAKNLTKASVLSLALTSGAVMLDGIHKSGYSMETAFAGYAEFVVGMFALVAVVSTIVYLFVEEN